MRQTKREEREGKEEREREREVMMNHKVGQNNKMTSNPPDPSRLKFTPPANTTDSVESSVNTSLIKGIGGAIIFALINNKDST
jgi:hypothetical protein